MPDAFDDVALDGAGLAVLVSARIGVALFSITPLPVLRIKPDGSAGLLALLLILLALSDG
jgi:hypothetical protein